MLLDIHKKIRVGAIFENSPKPVWFSLNGEKVTVREVCYHWKEREGAYVIHKFSVNDGTNVYQLSFDSSDGCWYLEAMDDGVA
jgi:hypothetical protein